MQVQEVVFRKAKWLAGRGRWWAGWRRLLLLAVLGMVAGFVLAGSFFLLGRALRPGPRFRGAVVLPPRPAVGFALADTQGQVHHLFEYRGRWVWMLLCGSLEDPGCARALAKLAQAHRQVQAASGVDVQVIVVFAGESTGAREVTWSAPGGERLNFLWLMAEVSDLRDLAHSYEAGGDGVGSVSSLVSSVLLIDPGGFWRAAYPAFMSAEDLAEDLLNLTSRR